MKKKSSTKEKRYEEAMRDYFSRFPRPLKVPGATYPGRDELHDRDRSL